MYRGKRISVVVPAYNERELIVKTLLSVPEYVDGIIIVDDGSIDGTFELAESLRDSRLTVVRHEGNRGVGAAIQTGYKRSLESDTDIVAVMAGDNQMNPTDLPRLLDPIVEGRADYTKGNRLGSGPCANGMSCWRFLGNVILSVLTRLASGYWHVNDSQNGYTAIATSSLRSIELDKLFTYYGYCNDLLVKLNASSQRVHDVPMAARYGSEKSKIKYGRYIARVGYLLGRGFVWRIFRKYLSHGHNQKIAGNENPNQIQR